METEDISIENSEKDEEKMEDECLEDLQGEKRRKCAMQTLLNAYSDSDIDLQEFSP